MKGQSAAGNCAPRHASQKEAWLQVRLVFHFIFSSLIGGLVFVCPALERSGIHRAANGRTLNTERAKLVDGHRRSLAPPEVKIKCLARRADAKARQEQTICPLSCFGTGRTHGFSLVQISRTAAESGADCAQRKRRKSKILMHPNVEATPTANRRRDRPGDPCDCRPGVERPSRELPGAGTGRHSPFLHRHHGDQRDPGGGGRGTRHRRDQRVRRSPGGPQGQADPRRRALRLADLRRAGPGTSGPRQGVRRLRLLDLGQPKNGAPRI